MGYITVSSEDVRASLLDLLPPPLIFENSLFLLLTR